MDGRGFLFIFFCVRGRFFDCVEVYYVGIGIGMGIIYIIWEEGLRDLYLGGKLSLGDI